MTSTPAFYEVPPLTKGLDRLDVRDVRDWSDVAAIIQHDLASLVQSVLTRVSGCSSRGGSNRGGGAHLFAYRRYAPATADGVDPVVAGIIVRPGGSWDHFRVSGDLAGEAIGDVLYET